MAGRPFAARLALRQRPSGRPPGQGVGSAPRNASSSPCPRWTGRRQVLPGLRPAIDVPHPAADAIGRRSGLCKRLTAQSPGAIRGFLMPAGVRGRQAASRSGLGFPFYHPSGTGQNPESPGPPTLKKIPWIFGKLLKGRGCANRGKNGTICVANNFCLSNSTEKIELP